MVKVLILLPPLTLFLCVSKVLLYNRALRKRNAFPITDTELKLIAAAANTGRSSNPKNGYNTPAAIGTPSML